MMATQSGIKAIKLGNLANRTLRNALSNISSASNAQPASSPSGSTSNADESNGVSSNYFTASAAPKASDGPSYFSSAPPPSAGPTHIAIINDLSSRRSQDQTYKGQAKGDNGAGSGRNRFDYASRISASQIHLSSFNVSVTNRSADDDEETPRKKARSSRSRRRHSVATASQSSCTSQQVAYFTTNSSAKGTANGESLRARPSPSPALSAQGQASPQKEADTEYDYRQHFQKAVQTGTQQTPRLERAVSRNINRPIYNALPLFDPSRGIDLPTFFSRSPVAGARHLTTESAAVTQSDLPPIESLQKSKEVPEPSEDQVDAKAGAAETSASQAATQRTLPNQRASGRRRASSDPLPLYSVPKEVVDPAQVQPFIDAMRQSCEPGNREVNMLKSVAAYREGQKYNIQGHNTAIYTLVQARKFRTKISPLDEIMTLFEETLTLPTLAPNMATYGIMIEVLAQRDAQVAEQLAKLKKQVPNRMRQEGKEDEITDRMTARASIPTEIRSLAAEFKDAAPFQMYTALGRRAGDLPASSYIALLKRCVARQRTEFGLLMFKRREESLSTARPLFQTYSLLIDLYSGSFQPSLSKARSVFETYRDLQKDGSFDRPQSPLQQIPNEDPKLEEEKIWQSMLSAYFKAKEVHSAISLFEEMLSESSPLQPSITTFATVLSGMARCEGAATAVEWYERMVALPAFKAGSPAERQAILFDTIEFIAESDTYESVKAMHRLMKAAQSNSPDNVSLPAFNAYAKAAAAAWKAAPDGQKSPFSEVLDHILDMAPQMVTPFATKSLAKVDSQTIRTLCQYLMPDRRKQAFDLVGMVCKNLPQYTEYNRLGLASHLQLADIFDLLASPASASETLTLQDYLRLFKAAGQLQVQPREDFMSAGRAIVGNAETPQLDKSIDQQDTGNILRAFCAKNAPRSEAEPMIHYIATSDQLPLKVGSEYRRQSEPALRSYHPFTTAFEGAVSILGQDKARSYFSTIFGESANALFELAQIDSADSTSPPSSVSADTDSSVPGEEHILLSNTESDSTAATTITIDQSLLDADLGTPPVSDRPLSPIASYAQEQWQSFQQQPIPIWDGALTYRIQKLRLDKSSTHPAHLQAAKLDAFEMIKGAAKRGRMASPQDIAYVIEYLAHTNQQSAVQQLYLIGYDSLRMLDNAPSEQFEAWKALENAMLLANAHFGQLEKVGLHRDRLIEAGTAPSADAYGAMILNAHDTTDDATVAIELFQESRRLGVVPNTYLFNNLISRLSKARRTKAVLECFEQMKLAGVPTSSVTYGAVINACCKVGDKDSAVYLFEEMRQMPEFVPKVPPFNTMIQFFVSTQPDRDRALHYYNEMVKAGVKPSGHTYRLLLDCHGQIQPVNEPAMLVIFETLLRDVKTPVQGVHWASLIHSYGIAQNDLVKAREVFDGIASHPSSAPSYLRNTKLPDAIAYEAILNVLLHHKQSSLVEEYYQRMRESKVPSIAYIENVRMQAFLQAGDIANVRRVFDELSDAPGGVAAPGNHPEGRHHSRVLRSRSSQPSQDGVYREPSSYETMIRAEIASGNRDRATSIVELAALRAFPGPVVERLRGLLTQQPSSSGQEAPKSDSAAENHAEV